MTSNQPMSGTALCYAVQSGDILLVRALLAQGIDPNAKDDHGTPPLVFAANKSFEMVKLLVEKGANVNVDNANSVTPLKSCILGGAASREGTDFPRILQFLLDNGANISDADAQGKTSIDWAVSLGNKEALNILKSWQNKNDTARLSEFHNRATGRQNSLKGQRPKVIIRKNTP